MSYVDDLIVGSFIQDVPSPLSTFLPSFPPPLRYSYQTNRTIDPSPPRVRAEAFRLRVEMEAVQVFHKDEEDAPPVVCTIEACGVLLSGG